MNQLLAIIVFEVLIIACASIETSTPGENEYAQKKSSGSIIGAVDSAPYYSGVSDCKVVLEGMGIKDSISKEEIKTFHFDNLAPGNYNMYVNRSSSGLNLALINNIIVDDDSVSYVGILKKTFGGTVVKDWQGVKVSVADTSLSGAIEGKIMLDSKIDLDLAGVTAKDMGGVTAKDISIDFFDRLRHKVFAYSVNSTDTFRITGIPAGIYALVLNVKIQKRTLPISSAYVFNVIVKPRETAMIEFKAFHALYERDELEFPTPYIDWNPKYK